MSGRLTEKEARALIAQKLGTRPRAAHSLFVGELMHRLARLLGADVELFALVGYCHDLDYYEIDGDWTRHGLLAADALVSRLPDEALDAIRAHDHRTGMSADSLIADMLKLADALAVLDQHIGRDAMSELIEISATSLVSRHLPEKPWLGDIVDRIAGRHDIARADIAALLNDLPCQPSGRD